MVGIAQLVERLVVVQEVAGSSPVTHPNEKMADTNVSAIFQFLLKITHSREQSPTHELEQHLLDPSWPALLHR